MPKPQVHEGTHQNHQTHQTQQAHSQDIWASSGRLPRAIQASFKRLPVVFQVPSGSRLAVSKKIELDEEAARQRAATLEAKQKKLQEASDIQPELEVQAQLRQSIERLTADRKSVEEERKICGGVGGGVLVTNT